MSYYRNYSSSYTPPSSFRFFPKGMKFLLIFTTAVFLFQLFLQLGFRVGTFISTIFSFDSLHSFRSDRAFYWQAVTYLFLHGGFWHIFMNLFVLWMFGVELENVWGTRRFLTYYFLCGVGAAVSTLLVTPLFTIPAPTIGASGAIYGVLLAFGMLFPDTPVYLYFLIPIKTKYFVAILFAFEIWYGVTGTQDGIAHFAHLGGALVGLVYLLAYRKSIPTFGKISDFVKRGKENVQQRFTSRKSYANRKIFRRIFPRRSKRELERFQK